MKKIFNLFSRVALAQLVGFALMPLATRIYSPAAWGGFQFLTTFALIFSPFVLMSLNQAIVKEKNLNELWILVRKTIRLAIFNSLLITAILILYTQLLPLKVSISVVDYGLFYFILLFGGGLIISQSITLNQANYTEYGNYGIVQSVVGNALRIVLGVISPSTLSLLISIILASFVASYKKIKSIKINDLIKNDDGVSIFKIIQNDKNLTVFFTLSSFVGIFVNWGLVFFAPLIADVNELGIFALALMITRTPVFPFVSATINYNYSEAVKLGENSRQYTIMSLIIAVAGLIVGMIALILLFKWGEIFIHYVFGGSWIGAADYAVLLLIPMISAFVLHPVTNAFSILKDRLQEIFMVDLVQLLGMVVLCMFAYVEHLRLYEYVKYSILIFVISDFVKFLLITRKK